MSLSPAWPAPGCLPYVITQPGRKCSSTYYTSFWHITVWTHAVQLCLNFVFFIEFLSDLFSSIGEMWGLLAVIFLWVFLWKFRAKSCVSLKWRGLVWMPEAAFNEKSSGFVSTVCFKLGSQTTATLIQHQRVTLLDCIQILQCVFYSDKIRYWKKAQTLGLVTDSGSVHSIYFTFFHQYQLQKHTIEMTQTSTNV